MTSGIDRRFGLEAFDDDEDRAYELQHQMVHLARRRPRKWQRDDFVNVHMVDLGNMYVALREYIEAYSVPMLHKMDFNAFCNFCFLFSNRFR